jgi:prepilin-type N-terminal cleavage/methylation domain-containing protein
MTADNKMRTAKGFSLVEIAVVMVIIGLLIGGLIMPLSSQRDLNNRKQAEQQLNEVHDALLGFAATYGRLPCPATTTSNGLAAPDMATTNCQQEHGFVPARTLGLNGSFSNTNLLLDAWNNPLRYSLSSVGTWVYANDIVLGVIDADYRICRQSGCGGTSIVAEKIVAVIHSGGKDGAQTTTSPDQLENSDNDDDFASRTFSEGVNTEFDDLLRWVSPNALTFNLLRSGQLDES